MNRSSELEAFSANLKREVALKQSQSKLQLLIDKAASKRQAAEISKWSLSQPMEIDEIGEALKRGWEKTAHEYDNLVDTIRLEANRINQPLPDFLQESTPKIERAIECSKAGLPHDACYLKTYNSPYILNFPGKQCWVSDRTSSIDSICVPPRSLLPVSAGYHLFPIGVSEKLQADSKLLWTGDIEYSEYSKRFREHMNTV
jgi:hypothetical protein